MIIKEWLAIGRLQGITVADVAPKHERRLKRTVNVSQ
jgi:hypothetical protein